MARMLYMARKVIAQHWLDVNSPTIREYNNKVNWLVTLDKGIDLKRDGITTFQQ